MDLLKIVAVCIGMLIVSCAFAEPTNCNVCHSSVVAAGAHQALSTAGRCTDCHGESAGHAASPTSQLPQFTFTTKRGGHTDNGVCLTCHQAETKHWEASSHAVEDVACNACHTIHSEQTSLSQSSESQACYDCHPRIRTEQKLPSRHPVDEAQMRCVDCHSPHGSLTPGELIGINTLETCLTCHEPQRGPFLFDHPPASEDCLNCHEPHGAVHEPLLKARGPYLCQQCHMANFHPSNLNAGEGLPGRQPSADLLGRDCMNCHPKVHGSNHPSGARLTR